MLRFEVRPSANLILTSDSRLDLIGQYCEATQVGRMVDPCLQISQGVKTPNMVKAMTGLPSQDKSDFETIELFRCDPFFKKALDISKVSSSAWVFQRLDAKALAWKACAAEGLELEFLTKWNSIKQDKVVWFFLADNAGVFNELRLGKRAGLIDLQAERTFGKEKRTFRLIVKVSEHTIDQKDQHPLIPKVELEGGGMRHRLPAMEAIEHERYYGTNELFHVKINQFRSGTAALGQTRHQRDSASGGISLQLPRSDWVDEACRRYFTYPILAPALGAEDKPEGDNVPGGEVCGACHQTDFRLSPPLHRPRQSVSSAARLLAASNDDCAGVGLDRKKPFFTTVCQEK